MHNQSQTFRAEKRSAQASAHPLSQAQGGLFFVLTRADKGWAVKRARPSKKVWCSGLGLCLEMSLVFDFGQGLRCGLYIRHCRCHWIMAAWFVFLHFFLFPLCWYAVSERQTLLFFAGGLVGVLHLFQRVSFTTSTDSTTELYFRAATRQYRCYSKTKTTKYCLKHEGKSHLCHPWQN